MLKRTIQTISVALFIGLLIIFIAGLIPIRTPALPSSPDPAENYEEAVKRFEQVRESENGILMDDAAASILMTQGEKTDKVYVLIHGWTNSPFQWAAFGKLLYERGHNVLIMRLPYHGLASQSAGETQYATPDLLRDYADNTIDIAAGLGDEIHVVGLSAGGAVTAWVAQNRPDVARAMAVSPMFGLGKSTKQSDYWITNAAIRLPNINVSDPRKEDQAHLYQGQSTTGVANALLFERAIFEQAGAGKTAVSDIIIVTNDNDHTVSNVRTADLVTLWEAMGTTVITHTLAEELGHPHDSIDPSANENVDEVYGILLDLLGE